MHNKRINWDIKSLASVAALLIIAKLFKPVMRALTLKDIYGRIRFFLESYI